MGSSRPHYDKLYSNSRDARQNPSVDHTIVKEKSCPNIIFAIVGFLAFAGLVTIFVLALLNASGPKNLTSL